MSKNEEKNKTEDLDEKIGTEEEREEVESSSEKEGLEKEVSSLQDKYTRLFAEFDNYKKRTSKEKVELIQTAGKEIITKLLPVLDDLERAMEAIEDTEYDTPVKEGVQLIQNKLYKFLEQEGLKPMEVKGQAFDPNFQEAVTTIAAPSDELKDKVVDVIEKGYFLNGKVLRYAKVVIGK